MSDVKLKMVESPLFTTTGLADSCEGCYHFGKEPETCPDFLNNDTSCHGGKIWVIDEQEIKTDKPASPWVKIEDAELVQDECYHCHFADSGEVVALYCDKRRSEFFWGSEGWDFDEITHVIHLPKPTPPSEL